jgi:predicted nuclease of predicted toxin-antitoxin system
MPWQPMPELTREERSATRRDRKKARFLVDEDVASEVAEVLREWGWNAKHATEVDLAHHSDEDVLAYAHRENRVLITHDLDYLDNRRFPPHRNPGVVVVRQFPHQVRVLIKELSRIAKIVGASRDLWRATKISVSPDVWLVSTFEPDTGRFVNARYRFTKHGDLEVWVDE